MLAVVQFPIADARLFCGVDRLEKPAWDYLQAKADYVHSFGSAKVRRNFEAVPAEWRDDAHYINASAAIRMRGSAYREMPESPAARPFWYYQPQHPATTCRFVPAFRRLFYDGIGLARIEVGLWVLSGGDVSGKGLIQLAGDLLDLQVQVSSLRGPAKSGNFGEQARNLATLFCDATTKKKQMHPEGPAAPSVKAVPPVIFLDGTVGIAHFAWRSQWLREIAHRLGSPTIGQFPSEATVVPKEITGTIRCAFTNVEYGNRRFGLWMLGESDRAQDLGARDLRISLMRLYATRQILIELERMAASRVIPLDRGPDLVEAFNSYLKDLAKTVLRQDAFGVKQAELQRVISLYDFGVGSEERERLEQEFDKLAIKREIRSRVYEATRPRRDTPTTFYVIEKGGVLMKQETNITNTGSGNITLRDINQVAGNFIKQSGEAASASNDAKIKEALETLRAQVEALAKRLPNDEAQNAAARKLKTLTEEAASGSPDKSVLKVTGTGLMEAAKTAVELMGPISTAVKAVWALLGVV